ncbi:putative endoribonuclease L-PSP [Serratia marcescens]|uniref:Putative endoribonuclease L-PSP n=1 Tax=Serratia marcescens TaxID=615 RepID=A0A379ZYZ4_SERMA|nr:putative endoribonuclease L-PSP [Serratia marcescens]
MKNGITHYHHGVIWEEENGVSQGVRVKDTLYISGQFSHDMQGEFIGAGDIERQTQQTLDNLESGIGGIRRRTFEPGVCGDLPDRRTGAR